jgi:hypothetical protein
VGLKGGVEGGEGLGGGEPMEGLLGEWRVSFWIVVCCVGGVLCSW